MKTVVDIINRQKDVPFAKPYRDIIRSAVKGVLRAESIAAPSEVSVLVTDDDGIRALNRQYRGIDSHTDVLSFALEEGAGRLSDEPVFLGDIVISAERAAAQAKEYGHTLEREFAFLSVHAALHLLGYDHEAGPEKEAVMFSRQKEILRVLGYGQR